MDINQLYFDHQTLQMKARATTSSDRQRAHCRDAADIAGRIGNMQHLLGAAAAPGWMAIAARKCASDETSSRIPGAAPIAVLADGVGGRAE